MLHFHRKERRSAPAAAGVEIVRAALAFACVLVIGSGLVLMVPR